MGLKFKKGDEVIVISGSDRKKVGKILEILGNKVVVEKVNIAKVHRKPTSTESGKVVSVEKPIHISNISHIENESPVKAGFLIDSGEGKAFTRKFRVFKKSRKRIQ